VDIFGIASTSSPIRFPVISNPPAIVTPVILPPGRAMLPTSPEAIGSNITVTIGIVVVAILKSNDRRTVDITIKSGCVLTTSRASSG